MDRKHCHFRRAPRASSLGTPKDSRMDLRISIPMPQKPLRRAESENRLTRLLYISLTHGMDCWAFASWGVLSNPVKQMVSGRNANRPLTMDDKRWSMVHRPWSRLESGHH